jgi:para-aminobenzoate synthetase component 1
MTPLAGSSARVLKATVREAPWPADVEGVFGRLSARPGCVWLDSAGGPPALARWSVLAAAPSAILEHEEDVTRLCATAGPRPAPRSPATDRTHGPQATRGSRRVLIEARGRPMDALREALRASPVEADAAAAALPFGPGFYGYLSYDLAPYIEPTATLRGRRDIPLPDLWFGLYEAVLVLDHQDRRAYLAGAPGAAWSALEEALADESAACQPEGSEQVDGPRPEKGQTAKAAAHRGPDSVRSLRAADPEPRLTCNMTRDEFMQAVARAREYIAAGDIFQVNLSRRLTAPLPGPGGAAALYLRLRRANPAPYAAYVDLGGGRAVLSSSPELFLDLKDAAVVTRPIKGTRPHRPRAEAYNARMRAELVASEKDRAELVMIVDLERNDLGRVCSYGSVRVAEPRAIETYASVYHTVATVQGRLHEGRDVVDLLRATFPGGSITGAPKIRSMQIIAELEPTRRSVYTGAVGYLGPAAPGRPAGRCVLNIAIRTLLAAAGRVHLQAGGGIVADSQPQAEFEETRDKARAILKALRLDGNDK